MQLLTASGRLFIGVCFPGIKADVNDLMSNISLCRGFWSNGTRPNTLYDYSVDCLELRHVRRIDLLMPRLADYQGHHFLFGTGDTVLVTVDCTDDTYRLQCRQSGLDYVGYLNSASRNVENIRWSLIINMLGGEFSLQAC